MSKKILPHIITIVSFVVFIVLGLACASTPDQSGTQQRLYSWEDYANRAIKHDKDGNYNLAIEDLNEAIRLNPNRTQLYAGRSLLHSKNGNYDLAIEDVNEALRLNPNYAEAYNQRAWIYAYYLKKDFDRALADANQALRLTPNDADYFDTRGWVYLGMKDYNRAIDDFNRALQLDRNLERSKEGLKNIREAQAKEKID